jgi:hypothetical protein
MTMTLNGKVVCWFSAERTASLTVRIRLRTGIMTEASYSKVWEEKSAENFVYKANDKDVRYSNDPWGTSTAVSIAVNLPLIQK